MNDAQLISSLAAFLVGAIGGFSAGLWLGIVILVSWIRKNRPE